MKLRIAVTMTLEIDGNVLEGGGQILRSAITYGVLLNKPLIIYNIRGKRSKPGLCAQHLSSINLVKSMSKAAITGASLGSTQVTVSDSHKCKSQQTYDCNCGTAGSITLMIQASYLIAAFAVPADFNVHTTLDLFGGTDYFGINMNVETLRRGFFPKGGGHVRCNVCSLPNGQSMQPVNIVNRGSQITHIEGIAYTAGSVPVFAATEMSKTANIMLQQLGLRLKSEGVADSPIITQRLSGTQAIGNGSGIHICVTTDTGCVYYSSVQGSRDISPNKTASDCIAALCEQLSHGGCFDNFLQDQLVLPMSLAEGTSNILCGGPLSLHTKTAIYIAGLITGATFKIHDPIPMELETSLAISPFTPLFKDVNGPFSSNRVLVSCCGVGLRNVDKKSVS